MCKKKIVKHDGSIYCKENELPLIFETNAQAENFIKTQLWSKNCYDWYITNAENVFQNIGTYSKVWTSPGVRG